MKAKMVLFLFVMGVILGGCSVKSNKDILLDDTKTNQLQVIQIKEKYFF